MCTNNVHLKYSIRSSKEMEIYTMFPKKETHSISLVDLNNLYKTEEDAQKFFYNAKWPEGYHCAKCNCDKADYLEKRKVYQCRKCKHQESITTHTALENTKVPLLKWLLLLYLYSNSKTGISAKYLGTMIGVNYNTAKLMVRKIKAAQAQNNEKYPVLKCDVIELDTFLFGGKKKGKRGLGAKGKLCVAIAAIKDYVEVDENGTSKVYEKTKAVKFKIVDSENKVEITNFLNSMVPSDCLVCCDASTTNRSIKIEGKKIDARKFDPDSHYLSSADHMIGNLKSKIEGSLHGIELQYLENELADFEWKFARHTRNSKSIFESLARTVINGMHKTRDYLIQYFKDTKQRMNEIIVQEP